MYTEPSFPFVYFGQGCSYYDKDFECCLWFCQKITEEDRAKILQRNPFLNGVFQLYTSFSQALFFMGGKDQEFTIKQTLNPAFRALPKEDPAFWKNEAAFMPSDEEWKRFDAMVAEWLLQIHQQYPIAFVFKPAKIFKKKEKNIYGTYGDWHRWSTEHLSQTVLPVFSRRG